MLFFELQGLTAVLVLLGDFFTLWINQCYELGPWGFGNVIGFRWHFASQSVKQPNVDTAEQFQLFPLAPSSFLGRDILCLYFCLPSRIVTLLNSFIFLSEISFCFSPLWDTTAPRLLYPPPNFILRNFFPDLHRF